MSSVRLRGIERRFGATIALDSADLTARPGEVHAVLGENGAGKTTLLSILAGEISPDGGTIELDSGTASFTSPREAWAAGIGMVHQHFALVPRLTVLENLLLGTSAPAVAPLPVEQMRARAGEVAARAGLSLDLDRRVEALGVGEQQRVEILKVLIRDPAIIILDEPTAVLTPQEVEPLLELLRSQARQGRTVLMVAHKLDEVLAVADRVTVLRQGRTVLEEERARVDAETLSRAMVGESVPLPGSVVGLDATHVAGGIAGDVAGRLATSVGTRVETHRADHVETGVETASATTPSMPPKPVTPPTPLTAPTPPTPPIARLQSVSTRHDRGVTLRGVSLSVARGEVVGIAGVEGNGQRDLARVLAGIDAPTEGTVDLPAGVGFVPQDRRAEGLVPDFTLIENLALAWADDPEYRRGPFLRWGALRRKAAAELERFGVRAAGPDARAATLSGGNQQRVVLARELARGRDLLVAENPTRGLDVAGTAWVRTAIQELVGPKDDGAAVPGVVLISTDLDEILALSHRVLVLLRGELLEVPANEMSREGIGRRMVGDV